MHLQCDVCLKYLKFAISWIHNKHDTIHSQGSLCDVCGNDAFSYTIWSLEKEAQAWGKIGDTCVQVLKDVK